MVIARWKLGAVSAGAGLAALTAAVGDLAPAVRRGVVDSAYATAGDIGAAAEAVPRLRAGCCHPLSWLYLICALALSLLILRHLR